MSLRLSKREFEKVYIPKSDYLVRLNFLVISLIDDNSRNDQYTKIKNVALEEYDDGHIRITGIGDQDIPVTISSNNWILFGKYW